MMIPIKIPRMKTIFFVIFGQIAFALIQVTHAPLKHIHHPNNFTFTGIEAKRKDLESIIISFFVNNESFILQLDEDHKIFDKDVAKNSNLSPTSIKEVRSFHCRVLSENQFNDIVQNGKSSQFYYNESEDLGWGRISARKISSKNKTDNILNKWEFQGTFSKNEDVYNIMPTWRYKRVRHRDDYPVHEDSKLVIYKESNRNVIPEQSNETFCGSADFSLPLHKRSINPNCPKTKKTLNIGIAADCTYIAFHGGIDKALAQIISVVNSAR